MWSAAGLLLVQILASGLLPRSYGLMATADTSLLLMMGLATFAMARNIAPSVGRTRLAWWLFAASFGMEALAQFFWSYFQLFRQTEVPNPFAGDILLFLSWVPLLAALLLRPHLEPSEGDRRLGILDFLLLFSWWLYLYLFLVVPWEYISPNETTGDRNYNILTLTESAVTAAVLALLWKQCSGLWQRFYGAFLAVAALQIIGDYRINAAIDRHQYFTGSWYDLPPAVALVGWAVVAYLGYGLAAAPVRPERPEAETYWMWSSRMAALVRITLPVLVAWVFLDVHVPAVVRSYRIWLTLGTMMVLGVIVSIRQLRLDSELAHVNQDLREASLTDVLTGVRNRRFFANTIESDAQQVLRAYSPNATSDARNRDLIFYLVDVDHFKEINDRFGHDVGDQVLAEVTRRISTAIRHSDALIRWGGEEFLVVSRYTDRTEATALAERVLVAVGGQPFPLPGSEACMRKTCSVGWAPFPWQTSDPGAVTYEQVIAYADRALYVGKRSGRNQAVGVLPAGQGVHGTLSPGTESAGASASAVQVATVITLGPSAPLEPASERPLAAQPSFNPEGI